MNVRVHKSFIGLLLDNVGQVTDNLQVRRLCHFKNLDVMQVIIKERNICDEWKLNDWSLDYVFC